MKRSISYVAAAVFMLLGLIAGRLSEQAAASSPLPLTNGDGLHLTAHAQLDQRLLALTFTTPALANPVNVRILLPTGYSTNPGRHYPVLYLFDGTSGHASDWTTLGDAEQTTAGLPLIVVMPDIDFNGNGGGWCTNSVNGGAFGQPEWETFHIDELIPWVDQNFHTVASRDGRAIAGLSQGGFCSMSYAAQFPDMFVTAAAFSGAPDIAFDPVAQIGATAIINATEVGLDGIAPDSLFGNPLTDEINWSAHDPATLANNLRGMNLLLFTGNGQTGPLDPAPNLGGSALESLVGFDNQYFHQRLDSLGIAHYFDDYGPGTHSWPYWTRDLQQSIGSIMNTFAHPPANPSSVTYTSAQPEYSEFGWSVAMDRTAEEFSSLENANAGGFSLAGSGAAVVKTPVLYQPGQQYSVTFAGPLFDGSATTTADRSGRLTLLVPLGLSNPYQEYTVDAAISGGTKTFTTSVAIRPES